MSEDSHGMAEDNDFYSGISVQRWRLRHDRTPRRVFWALQVIKMYLHGEKHGYVPRYPTL